MNRAALSEALMSMHPACSLGWLAITPTHRPFRWMNPVSMFLAKYGWYSKKLPPSATVSITRRMS